MSMKNSNYTIGSRTRDLPACSAVPQTTVPPCAPIKSYLAVINCNNCNCTSTICRVACLLIHIYSEVNINLTHSFVEWVLNSEWSVSNLMGWYALSVGEYIQNYLPTDMTNCHQHRCKNLKYYTVLNMFSYTHCLVFDLEM